MSPNPSPSMPVRGHGKKGRVIYREYRQVKSKAGKLTGLYYARDRWYSHKDTTTGRWKKKSRNRKDIKPLTGEQYEQWKQSRQQAKREAKRRLNLRNIKRVTAPHS